MIHVQRQHNNEIIFYPIFKLEKTWQVGRSGKNALYRSSSGSVGLLPILPNGEILLVKQFRIAVNSFIYEIGRMKDPRAPLDAAKRELQEETGYTAKPGPLSFFLRIARLR